MGDVTIEGAQATTLGPEPAKAYLDNCIVGAIAKGEPEEETAILSLWHGRRIGLVTSSVTEEEIAKSRWSIGERTRSSTSCY